MKLHRVDLLDAPDVTAAFERCLQPNPDNFHCHLFRDYPLTERKNVGVVVLPGQTGDFLIPAKRATDAVNFVGNHRFPVSGSTEDKTALALAAGDRFGGGADE